MRIERNELFRWALCLALTVAACDRPPPAEPSWVVIPRQASLTEVSDSLERHGIVSSARAFRWYAKMAGKARGLRGGVYRLSPDMLLGEVAARLAEGSPPMVRVVVPEGAMLSEVAGMLERTLTISAEAFHRAVRDSALRARVGVRGETLEGYLYPDTYYVRRAAGAHEVVALMVEEFESHWEPSWSDQLAGLGLTRDELVTLASIIEGEVRYRSDGPLVSSVYHNRLGRAMRLQADPTVIYALGARRRLYHRDYRIESPYNTYRVDGLPPTPIAQPSGESLRDALFPTQTDFLYFVAGPEGRHVFSRSYREHVDAIRRLRGPEGGRARRTGAKVAKVGARG